MSDPTHGEGGPAAFARYPLLDALRERRSRRFGAGMRMEAGPLAHTSALPPQRLSEEEEAILAFAACGITGHALVELDFRPGEGGTIIAGTRGRTVASGDAIHTVSVFVTNEDATYLLKRPGDFAADEIPDLVELARQGRFVEAYRRSRVKVKDGRAAPPLHPFYNLAVNQWSLYDSGSTYFLPVNELTLLYINGVMEVLDDPTAAFIVDERAGFRPAGLGRFARRRGGRLHDDPNDERILTIQQLESLVTEFVTIEQGMVHQNLALAAQAMGLGGFPHWAAHPYGWLEELGFATRRIKASRYLGMGRLMSLFAGLLGKDPSVSLGCGLEVDGETLLAPYCPPFRASMEEAVKAVYDLKFGPQGIFRGGVRATAFRDPERVAEIARPPSDDAVAATIAHCEYVWDRYGRFPAYQPPFRTVLGFQTGHVDAEFYARHYRDGALSESQRRHQAVWHAAAE